MGLEMGWFPLGVFNQEKGAIWQSHLAAQKEGVVPTIIFSNHKTSIMDPITNPITEHKVVWLEKKHYSPHYEPH